MKDNLILFILHSRENKINSALSLSDSLVTVEFELVYVCIYSIHSIERYLLLDTGR